MRNVCLFENHLRGFDSIYNHIIQLNEEFISKRVANSRPIYLKDIQPNGAIGYFDGATKDGFYAAGVALMINNIHSFKFKLHCGIGTNMKAELLALWCLCKVATVFGIVSLQVFGDSRVTIKWAIGDFNLQVLTVTPW